MDDRCGVAVEMVEHPFLLCHNDEIEEKTAADRNEGKRISCGRTKRVYVCIVWTDMVPYLLRGF